MSLIDRLIEKWKDRFLNIHLGQEGKNCRPTLSFVSEIIEDLKSLKTKYEFGEETPKVGEVWYTDNRTKVLIIESEHSNIADRDYFQCILFENIPTQRKIPKVALTEKISNSINDYFKKRFCL